MYDQGLYTSQSARLNLVISKETDRALRVFLAERGMKKGDLSKFVEDAVRWRMLDQSLTDARARFSDLSPEEGAALIDEAVTAVRRSPKDYMDD